MKRSNAIASLWLVFLFPVGSSAQTGVSARPSTATQVALDLVTSMDKQLTAVAEEMPAEKYDFAPTEGAFRNVRNFARQIKHAAAVQHLVAATILGERVTSDMADERGPDTVRTKPEVLQYLRESFAALERAAATIDEKNAFAPVQGAFTSATDTRIGLVAKALSHSSNHYGQVVEYLRMNGIQPPRTE